jgi:putative ABC transport system ATP-binding protein
VYERGGSKITAVKDANLEIGEGKFVTLIGPSGSGKTTLLNLLGLIDRPTSGKVFFKGVDSSKLGARELREIRLHDIGFVFQSLNIIPTLTAEENVELPMSLQRVPQSIQKSRAKELLTAVDLSERTKHRPRELSMGEQQRVAIARALANNPNLIIADEPTAQLDSETALKLTTMFMDLCHEEKKTIIMATHDEKLIKKCDLVYWVRDGEVIPQSP